MESVQTRISAFGALAAKPTAFLESPPPSMMAAASVVVPPDSSPSPSPPNLGRKSSPIDLKDWVVDDGPLGSSKGYLNNHIEKTPTQRTVSNMQLSRDHLTTATAATTTTPNVPLIDLSSPPKPKLKPKPANLSSNPTAKGVATAASQNSTNGKLRPPKLPPRKSSQPSLRSSSAIEGKLNFLYPPRRQGSPGVDQGFEFHSRNSSHGPTSSISSFHSVSLSSDTDTSTPNESLSTFIATFPVERERSASSADADSVSLSESYEEVSTSCLASPAAVEKIEWQYATRKPPKLPDRPFPIVKPSPPPTRVAGQTDDSLSTAPVVRPSLSRRSSISTLSNAVPPYSPPRRVAPPPPPSRSSDRSSILSSTSYSSHSSHSLSRQLSPIAGTAPAITLKIKRPSPVPLAARKRYESVFIKNVHQRRKVRPAKENDKMLAPPEVSRNRRAAGWRGLSVDLIPVDDEIANKQKRHAQKQEKVEVFGEVVMNQEKLEGAIVKLIWTQSGLDSSRLAEIWNECDLTDQGALDLDSFVRGMWRIDEELRRIRAQVLKSATSRLGPYRGSTVQNVPASRPTRYRDILR